MKCRCGNENLVIKLVGDDSNYEKDQVIQVLETNNGFFLIINVFCNVCKSEHLIFNNDFHGWNGFVCGGDNREMDRLEPKQWDCDKCNNSEHKIELQIESQGKEDFMEEGGEEFGEHNWTEGFSWLTIKTECINCNKTNPEWISYETM